MSHIVKVQTELKNLLPGSDEIWIAVALAKKDGINFIFDTVKSTTIQHYLVGIDLPTDSEVFHLLNSKISDGLFDARIYYKPNKTFHPKLYIIRKGTKYTALIGSANCTIGGLSDNIELSFRIEDQDECQKLVNWFNIQFKNGRSISEKFLNRYQPKSSNSSSNDTLSLLDLFDEDEVYFNRNEEIDLTLINFTNQFFTFEHYDAFSGGKPLQKSVEVNEERKQVKHRLYDLDDLLFPIIQTKGWDLHPHPRYANTISSDEHGIRTARELGALWLHYGKRDIELKEYKDKYGESQSSVYHIRLQALVNRNFFCTLIVGKDDACYYDRQHFKEQMEKDLNYRRRFFNLVKNLNEEFYVEINEVTRHIDEFENAEDLYDFVKNDKIRNYYFVIGKNYSPNDKRISIQNISKTVIDDFTLLNPIYQHIRHNPFNKISN